MTHQNTRFLLLTMLIFIFAISSALAADTDQAQIVINEVKYEDYVRNPRMEEEDRLQNNVFTYRPGLEIITDAQDVEIRFFEERIGVTPWEADDLAPGAYRVQLRRTGYEILEFWVTVRIDRRTVVVVTMGKPSGTLVLNDLPPGAEVMIDRVLVEGTNVSAQAGTRSLKVIAFGWETVQDSVEIASSESVEWNYEGQRTPFSIDTLKTRPSVLPADDLRGFRFDWTASSAGSADIMIFDPDGTQVASIPFSVSSAKGSANWRPMSESGKELPDGEYRVVAAGTGFDETSSSIESSVYLDQRFRREPRPSYAPLPGLLYAAGAAMLPKGIWQASTSAGIDIGTGDANSSDGIPVIVGVRFSPARRWEISGKFGMTARDPFDATSLEMSLSGSWRVNKKSGPYTVNLALLFSYGGYAADFGRSPSVNPGMALPGLQFSAPMEWALGNWNIVLSPSIYMTFLGEDPSEWTFNGPPRAVGSIGSGVYYEDGRFLVGFSAALRSPDYPREFLDYTIWTGLEGRFDLPGDASYLALYTGVRTLESDPVVSVGIEFGVIR